MSFCKYSIMEIDYEFNITKHLSSFNSNYYLKLSSVSYTCKFKARPIWSKGWMLLKRYFILSVHKRLIIKSNIATTILPLDTLIKKWMNNLLFGQLKKVSNNSINTKWHTLQVSEKHSQKLLSTSNKTQLSREKINWSVSKNQDRVR